MSDDQIQSEQDFLRNQEYMPPPLAGAISERAWIKRDLEFWHRCTIEACTRTAVTVSLDNLDELTVEPDRVRKFDLQRGDLVFRQHWDGSLSGFPGFVHWVDGETLEVEFPARFYGKSERYLHLLRDLRVYMNLEPGIWQKGSRVFAYKRVQFYPALFLLFPAVVQDTHHDVCVVVEFGDGETAFVPTTLVQPFELNVGDIVHTCTSYVSHGINPDERWSPCLVLGRDGDTLFLQDGSGERFEAPVEMIAVLPKGYQMIDGKFERISKDRAETAGRSTIALSMSGDVHIVRTEDWRSAADDPITKPLLDELIALDPELAWSIGGSADSDGNKARYVSILWKGQPCFWWYGTEVRCPKPNDAQLAKMIEIAVALDANVVGENGEEYH